MANSMFDELARFNKGNAFGMPSNELVSLLTQQGVPVARANEIASGLLGNDLATASWTQLHALRDLPETAGIQKQLAPYEHRAYTRQLSALSPVAGILSGTLANTVYEGLKTTPKSFQKWLGERNPDLDVSKSRSGASWANYGQGLFGTLEGLAGAAGFNDLVQKIELGYEIDDLMLRLKYADEGTKKFSELQKKLSEKQSTLKALK
jgi:hypothetical protein